MELWAGVEIFFLHKQKYHQRIHGMILWQKTTITYCAKDLDTYQVALPMPEPKSNMVCG